MADSESSSAPPQSRRHRWTLAQRFFVMTVGALLCTLLVAVLLLQSFASEAAVRNGVRLRKVLTEHYDQTVKHQVEAIHSELAILVATQESGLLTRAQTEQLGAQLLRDARYGTDGYFWADTYEGVNVVLLDQESEGKPRWDARDANGRYFIRELNFAGRQPGGGFVDYSFPRPGRAEPSAKRGYVLAFEPFRWVVGTGYYIDDIEAEVEKQSRESKAIAASVNAQFFGVLSLFFLGVVILVFVGTMKVSAPLRELKGRLENLASSEPDLDVELEVRSRDDVAALIVAFNRFVSRYKRAFHHQSSYQLLTEKLAMLAEAHDEETSYHTVRVGDVSALLAGHLGLPVHEREAIRVAATLHDVGKLFLNPELINKTGPLLLEEKEVLKSHTLLAEKLLDGPQFELERTIAVYHHERWDGSGYPLGLKGDAIPLAAQIVGLADVYDALRSKRPYKEPLTPTQAVFILKEGDARTPAGGFNPRILAALEACLEEVEGTVYAAYPAGS